MLDKNDTASLRAYIKNIRKLHRRLQRKDEVAFMKKIAQGDTSARETFIAINLPLVIKIAFRYASVAKSLTVLDLIQEGNLGLMEAVEKFNPKLGYKFSTYAVWWIRQHIGRAIANNDTTVRIPVHAHELVHKYRQMIQDLTLTLDHEPSFREIVTKMKLGAGEIKTLENALICHQILSLDTKTTRPDEGDLFLLDRIIDPGPSPEEIVIEENTRRVNAAKVHKMLRELTPREQTTLWLRHGEDDRTLASIGRQLGISRERVRQIEKRALAQCLRAASEYACP